MKFIIIVTLFIVCDTYAKPFSLDSWKLNRKVVGHDLTPKTEHSALQNIKHLFNLAQSVRDDLKQKRIMNMFDKINISISYLADTLGLLPKIQTHLLALTQFESDLQPAALEKNIPRMKKDLYNIDRLLKSLIVRDSSATGGIVFLLFQSNSSFLPLPASQSSQSVFRNPTISKFNGIRMRN